MAIAEYSYSGDLYKYACATLQRKFSQRHHIVGAHLNMLASFPPSNCIDQRMSLFSPSLFLD